MADKKRLTDCNAEFPNNRILDGTLSLMSVAEIRIYLCMKMWVNYRTKIGRVSNKQIGRYCNITSGARVKEAVHNLEYKHRLIQTWTKHKRKWDGEPSDHTVRYYRIQEEDNDERVQDARNFNRRMRSLRR